MLCRPVLMASGDDSHTLELDHPGSTRGDDDNATRQDGHNVGHAPLYILTLRVDFTVETFWCILNSCSYLGSSDLSPSMLTLCSA